MPEFKVLYFASYKDQAGVKKETISIVSEEKFTTLGSLIKAVCDLHTSILPSPEKIVAAVNEEYREHDHLLQEGDIVALIPPVSGGSGNKNSSRVELAQGTNSFSV